MRPEHSGRMAESTTPRLGLSVYDSGNDLHPDRAKFNAQQNLLDKLLATAMQGTMAERPAAGVGGALFWATDSSRLYFDDGIAWRDVNTTGGGGAGAPISVGGSAAEGTSARAARSDHTHALPLATATAPGALSAADKKKLDAATPAATPNTLMLTDANGRTQLAAPLNQADAANKAYVDQTAANASNLTSGTVPAARLPEVTASVNGAMLAADKAKLDAATGNFSSSTLAMRDGNGNLNANSFYTPTGGSQSTLPHALTRKDYVDTQVATRAPTSHKHAAGDLNPGDLTMARLRLTSTSDASATSTAHAFQVGDDAALNIIMDNNEILGRNNGVASPVMFPHGINNLPVPTNTSDATRKDYVDAQVATRAPLSHTHAEATTSAAGFISAADQKKLDSATALATANTLVMNDAYGRFSVTSPTQAAQAANKAYVDGKTWDGSDITTGLINQARIANATASLNGLMSSVDKAKLDAAGYNAGPNTLVMMNSSGYIKAAAVFTDETATQYNSVHALTRKDYVDGRIADVFTGTEIPDSANLNNYVTPGVYNNSTNASVVTGSNYPSALAGKLEVVKSASGNMIYQEWIDYSSTGAKYYRTRFGSTWYAWKEVVSDRTASKLAYSAAAGPTLFSNFDTYTTPGPYLTAGSSTVQDYLLEVFSQPDGDLMQRRTTTVGSNKVMVRFRRSGTWTPWSLL